MTIIDFNNMYRFPDVALVIVTTISPVPLPVNVRSVVVVPVDEVCELPKAAPPTVTLTVAAA